MPHPFMNRVHKGLHGLAGCALHGYPLKFDYTKKRLIDSAFRLVVPAPRSFADLGGVWGIDGAYTFYILDNHPISSAFLVDTDFTEFVRTKSRHYQNLLLLNQNFADRSLPERIGHVDAIVLFDVLLHQVKPDWNEVLEMYAPATNCFIIYNQQIIGQDRSVRLLDLGFDKYFELVRVNRKSALYRNLEENPDKPHPAHGRAWRDIHNVWQWGITDGDLVHMLERLGYEMIYQKNWGQFSNFKRFENHAFIFRKRLRTH